MDGSNVVPLSGADIAREVAASLKSNAVARAPSNIHVGNIQYTEFVSATLNPKPIIDDFLSPDLALFVGAGGVSKTTFIEYIAVHIILGRKVLGRDVLRPGSVLYFTAEDSRERLVARLRCICEDMELTAEETRLVASGFFIADVSENSFRLTEILKETVQPVEEVISWIVDTCQNVAPVLVIFDPAVSFGVGEHRVNDAEQGLVQAARKIIRSIECCVLFVTHTGKANGRERTTDQYSSRGGSAFADGARMVFTLVEVEHSGWKKKTGHELSLGDVPLLLTPAKMSYAPAQSPIYLKRSGFAFQHFDDIKLSPDAALNISADKVWQFLKHELSAFRYHSMNTLESSGLGPTRNEMRAAVGRLKATGRVEIRDRDGIHANGARQYLHPTDVPKYPSQFSFGN